MSNLRCAVRTVGSGPEGSGSPQQLTPGRSPSSTPGHCTRFNVQPTTPPKSAASPTVSGQTANLLLHWTLQRLLPDLTGWPQQRSSDPEGPKPGCRSGPAAQTDQVLSSYLRPSILAASVKEAAPHGAACEGVHRKRHSSPQVCRHPGQQTRQVPNRTSNMISHLGPWSGPYSRQLTTSYPDTDLLVIGARVQQASATRATSVEFYWVELIRGRFSSAALRAKLQSPSFRDEIFRRD